MNSKRNFERKDRLYSDAMEVGENVMRLEKMEVGENVMSEKNVFIKPLIIHNMGTEQLHFRYILRSHILQQ